MLDALAMLNSYLACINRGTHVNPFKPLKGEVFHARFFWNYSGSLIKE
jgi:hypothetical protein